MVLGELDAWKHLSELYRSVLRALRHGVTHPWPMDLLQGLPSCCFSPCLCGSTQRTCAFQPSLARISAAKQSQILYRVRLPEHRDVFPTTPAEAVFLHFPAPLVRCPCHDSDASGSHLAAGACRLQFPPCKLGSLSSHPCSMPTSSRTSSGCECRAW